MSTNSIQKKLLRGTMGILLPAFLVTIAVVALLSILQSKDNSQATEKQIRGSMQAKGRLLVGNNAQALSGMVADNAFLSVQSIVSQTVQEDEDVVYGIFMTNERQAWVLANDKNPAGTVEGQVILDDSTAKWAATISKMQTHTFQDSTGAELIEFAAPVLIDGEPAGWLRYGMSTENLRQALTDARSKAKMAMVRLLAILVGLAAAALFVAFIMARRQSATFSRPIQELNAAANIIAGGNYQQAVKVVSDDEVGDLAQSFEYMRQTVKNYTEHLEDLVNEKMRQVRDILDNIDQGLFTVNLDGTINDEYSRSTNRILALENVASGDVTTALHLEAQGLQDWKDWVHLVLARYKSMRWDKLLKLAPALEFDLGENGNTRTVKVSYQPVLDAKGELVRIMVLVMDITESRKVERIIAEEKMRHENEVKTILGLVNTLPEVVQDFFADTDTRINLIEKNLVNLREDCNRTRDQLPDGDLICNDQNLVSAIFRDLHTIKGNSATYGFEALSAVAHHAEDILEALQPPIRANTADTIMSLFSKLEELKDERQGIDGISRRLRGGDQLMVHIAESKVKYLDSLSRKISKEICKDGAPILSPLLDACRSLRDVPLVKLADKYRSMVERIGSKLEKQVAFVCVPESLELTPSFFKRINEAMIHILRNAVDHGIESPEQREQANKDPVGTIRLQVEALETSYRIKLIDDGKGVDTDTLVRKAIAMGAVTEAQTEKMTHQEKVALLFLPGLSTKSETTDISGRGVGMDSVQNSLEMIGASIQIQSELGFGSAFIMEIPNQAFSRDD